VFSTHAKIIVGVNFLFPKFKWLKIRVVTTGLKQFSLRVFDKKEIIYRKVTRNDMQSKDFKTISLL